MVHPVMERLIRQKLGLMNEGAKQDELHGPLTSPGQEDMLASGQTILNRRLRTKSQYNLVELQKAMDLAG